MNKFIEATHAQAIPRKRIELLGSALEKAGRSKCGQEVACAIAEGYDADIVVADKPEELHVEKVYAKGKQLVEAGKTIWPGYYVKDPYYNQNH